MIGLMYAVMAANMKEIAVHEAEMLKAWYGQAVFGCVIEEDKGTADRKPFESPIVVKDSLWGYYCLKNDTKEMYERIWNRTGRSCV